MKIYTSYYGNNRKLLLNKILPVAISNSVPKWFRPAKLKNLVPPWVIVSKSRAGKITDLQFKEEYLKQLNALNPSEVIQALEEIGKGNDIALLCYEKDPAECHRKIVAEWINQKTGIKVEEFQG